MARSNEEKPGGGMLAMAVLIAVCCALPLLLLSGISLATFVPSWRVIGVVMIVVGAIGLIWYLKRR